MPLNYTNPKFSTIYEGGAPVEDANVAVIFLHGKGGNAEIMFDRAAQAAEGTDDVVYFAPKSANKNWFWGDYTTADDPQLIRSLDAVGSLIGAINDAGIATENIVLVGFSQGAVVANEYLAQTGDNLKEVLAFSGSLVTPVGEVEGTPQADKYLNADPYGDISFDPLPSEFDGADLTGQTITLTVHDNDAKTPLALMRATADYYRSEGAQVELHVEPGKTHSYTSYDSQQLSDAMKFNMDTSSFVQTDLFNGGFVTAIEKSYRYDVTDSRITIKVFNEYGFTRIAQELEIDTSNGTFVNPALATLNNGNFVVVYADDVTDNLLGNIYDQTGNVVRDSVVLASGVDPLQRAVITVDGAGFDVGYHKSDGASVSSSYDVNGARNDIAPQPTTLPMNGNGGDNVLSGDDGDNVMKGYSGNDVMSGQGGSDTMYGGADNDTMYGNAGGDLVKGQTGNDQVYGNEGNDTLTGDAGDDILFGGSNTDTGFDKDALRGGAGNDTLYGGADNDTLKGENGNDHLFGGTGKNLLVGGAGADYFHFNGEASSDTINDFEAGIDVIEIQSSTVDSMDDLTIVHLSYGSNRIEFDGTSVLVKGVFYDTDIHFI